MLRAIVIAAAVVLAGCDKSGERAYSIKIVRPDGGVHETSTLRSWSEPVIMCGDGGHTSLYAGFKQQGTIPTGWYYEIEPLAEETP